MKDKLPEAIADVLHQTFNHIGGKLAGEMMEAMQYRKNQPKNPEGWQQYKRRDGQTGWKKDVGSGTGGRRTKKPKERTPSAKEAKAATQEKFGQAVQSALNGEQVDAATLDHFAGNMKHITVANLKDGLRKMGKKLGGNKDALFGRMMQLLKGKLKEATGGQPIDKMKPGRERNAAILAEQFMKNGKVDFDDPRLTKANQEKPSITDGGKDESLDDFDKRQLERNRKGMADAKARREKAKSIADAKPKGKPRPEPKKDKKKEPQKFKSLADLKKSRAERKKKPKPEAEPKNKLGDSGKVDRGEFDKNLKRMFKMSSYRGMVPVPHLIDNLKKSNPDLSDGDVHAVLDEMWDNKEVELVDINSRRGVEDFDRGFPGPTGKLYAIQKGRKYGEAYKPSITDQPKTPSITDGPKASYSKLDELKAKHKKLQSELRNIDMSDPSYKDKVRESNQAYSDMRVEEKRVGNEAVYSHYTPKDVKNPPKDLLKDSIKSAHGERSLFSKTKDGMVPIHDLYNTVKSVHSGVTEDAFKKTINEMWKDGDLQMHILNEMYNTDDQGKRMSLEGPGGRNDYHFVYPGSGNRERTGQGGTTFAGAKKWKSHKEGLGSVLGSKAKPSITG